jgi:hypothetical protein
VELITKAIAPVPHGQLDLEFIVRWIKFTPKGRTIGLILGPVHWDIAQARADEKPKPTNEIEDSNPPSKNMISWLPPMSLRLESEKQPRYDHAYATNHLGSPVEKLELLE